MLRQGIRVGRASGKCIGRIDVCRRVRLCAFSIRRARAYAWEKSPTWSHLGAALLVAATAAAVGHALAALVDRTLRAPPHGAALVPAVRCGGT